MKHLKQVLFVSGVILIPKFLWAQDSTISLAAVVVTGISNTKEKNTSLSIHAISMSDYALATSSNCTQALSILPSVQIFSTTNAISKPMIRGLYGNRVLVLYNGLKLDNQQWQDEHGLGISSIGVQRLELLKGPASVLYGSEAIGGVLHIVDGPKAKVNNREVVVNSLISTNDLHSLLNVGIATNKAKKWQSFYIGLERAADYVDGSNKRVLNSRYNGYYAKGNFGFIKKGWLSQNNYHFSYNQFGFVFSDMSIFFDADQRFSTRTVGPHHKVLLNMFSSQNQKNFKRSKLELTFGGQSNFRAEDEGGGALSLMMHLINVQGRLKYTYNLSPNSELILSQFAINETNRNYGKRKIVPNANMFEWQSAAFVRKKTSHFVLELGISEGFRRINALPTPQLNSTEKEIEPFIKNWFYPNAIAGIAYNPSNTLGFKLNVSNGVRAPNLAELSSNGLHEGIYTYELGNPNLKAERNLNISLDGAFRNPTFQCEASLFSNRFNGFVYLNPTNRDWFGFPVYEYVQQATTLQGYEFSLAYTPKVLNGIKGSMQTSYVVGKLNNNSYLPYMPPLCIKPKVEFQKNIEATKKVFACIWINAYSQQYKLAPTEKSTPAFTLCNLLVAFELKSRQLATTVSIGCNNLFNETYFSHLSRIKNFGYNNMGRNIFFNLKIKSTKSLKL